jgi:VanZ family protein
LNLRLLLRPVLRFGTAWFGLGLLMLIFVGIVSLVPGRDLPNLGISDKIEHALAYAVLSFWFGSILARRRLLVVMFIALLCFGALIEFLQGWMGLGRTADLRDMLANSLGAVLGLLLSITPLGNWAQRVEALWPARRAP